MKLNSILSILLAFLTHYAIAQPPDVEWTARFGGKLSDTVSDIIQTDDGGYLLLGRTESYTTSDGDIWLMKIDDGGKLEWETTYGGNEYDWGTSIVPAQDDGFIILGGTYSIGNGGSDMWLLGIDDSGEILWDTTFGGTFDETPSVVKASSSGEICIAGYTNSFGAGGSDAWILWVDEYGNLLSQETYGDEYYNTVNDIELLEGGSVAVLGETFPYGSNIDLWFFILDSEGSVSHEITYGYSSTDESAHSLTADPWGGYICVGNTNAFSGFYYDLWLVRLDQRGNVLSDGVYGWDMDEKGIDACITPEGDILIGGSATPSSVSSFDYYLLEVDSSGVLEWQTTFGSTFLEEMWNLELTSDGGCIMVGSAYTEIMFDIDTWLVKTAPLNQDPPEPPEELSITAFPNPLSSNSFLNIQLEMPSDGQVRMELYDLMGRSVEIIADENLGTGVHSIEWIPVSHGNPLPVGIYILNIRIDDERMHRTLMLIK